MTSHVHGIHKILIFMPVEWPLSEDEVGLEYGKEESVVTGYEIVVRYRE